MTPVPLPAAAVPATQPPAVRMAGICKRFGAVRANVDVALTLAPGSVHGLVGENGAGKSTLMSILYGLYAADAGRIEVFGRPVTIANPQQAIALGIGMVHQHFMLVPTLSALDNVMLGAETAFRLAAAAAHARRRLQALMARTGLQVDLDAPVSALGVGDCQRLEILKALYRGARILILDEPTAVLTPQEAEQLFGVLDALRRDGTTIVVITHKLKEVLRLCDRVTVMRGGRVVHECAAAETTVEALAQAMVGRHVALGRGAGAPAAGAGDGDGEGEARLQAEALTLVDGAGITRLAEVSLALHGGEIVGVAGVSGNGQSELLEVLAGLRAPQCGRLRLAGQVFTPPSWLDPQRARALRLAHVPEDRQARALVLDFAACESAILGYEDRPEYGRGALLDRRAVHQACAALMARFDVRPADPALASRRFSGGNQQKLVLARELGRAPLVLLVGQPTRGVDIGAIEFIHAQLRALRDAGCALLLVSSELDEILALADRVLVMAQGRITGALPIAECSETRLGLLMSASGAEQAA